MSKFDDMGSYLRGKMKISEGDCLLWCGQIDKDGYGQFRKFSIDQWHKAHRESWSAFCGEIPAGMNVLHKCDVPACINPAHLYLGTQKDNVRDMRERGRAKYVGSPKTQCKRGHELTLESRGGPRKTQCRLCTNQLQNERYKRNRRHSLDRSPVQTKAQPQAKRSSIRQSR